MRLRDGRNSDNVNKLDAQINALNVPFSRRPLTGECACTQEIIADLSAGIKPLTV